MMEISGALTGGARHRYERELADATEAVVPAFQAVFGAPRLTRGPRIWTGLKQARG
jgi:hypothetical protein